MLRWTRREKVPWEKAHSPSPTSSSECPGSNLPGGRGGEDGGGSKRGANGEGGRLGELTSLFLMEILVGANQAGDFCCLARERKCGGGGSEDGHVSPWSHMIHIPCDTFLSPGKEKGGAGESGAGGGKMV